MGTVAAEVAESHTTYLTLARPRSPRPLSHWLIALIAVMDAAALHLALAPSREPKLAARLSLRMGFVALGQIARTMRLPIPDDPDPDGSISVSFDEFRAATVMLRELGYPIERTDEQAWPNFRGWRANYDTAALLLARQLDAPPALWTGPRRWPSTPIPPAAPPPDCPETPNTGRRTAVKPSYGLAEATLSVSTTAPDARPNAIYLDRQQLSEHRAVPIAPDSPHAVALVSCGQVMRSQWAVIADPQTGAELPDGQIGEIWLHGDNIGRGYWGRERETESTFRNKLQSRLEYGSHAKGSPAAGQWLRTGDLGVYLNEELYITGRIKDLVIIDGRNHYPHDIEATVSEASPAVRSGFVAAFSVPADSLPGATTADTRERLVVIAERAPGAGRADEAPVADAIRAAISRRHHLPVADVRLVAAGTIPRTTSGKLARRACRSSYLSGVFRRG